MRWLIFGYVFLWPFVLPVICVGVVAFVRRERLLKTGAVLAGLIALSAAPLAYSVLTTDPFLNGIAISSLTIYPTALAVLVFAMLIRASFIWAKDRKLGVRRP